MKVTLYHYWRSSSSWRVRWALAIKGISCSYVPVDLLSNEPEHPDYLKKNPMGYVPVIEIFDGKNPPWYLSESMAILEWLEELQPEPSLFPSRNPNLRARARQLAEIINSGIQPIQNPNVVQYALSDPEKHKGWSQHWIRHGFTAYEKWVLQTAGKYSVGDQISLPDLFLIPQCYNATRNEVDLKEFPTIQRIYSVALQDPYSLASAPDRFKPSS